MQYSVISPRITCLYGSQLLSVVFECKTATFGTESQVCMGPRPHLSFCPFKSAWLAPEILVSMGPRHNLSFCACKTAWLAPEILVSMGPSPHLWFLHPKQRLLVQSTSLYGFQHSSVVWCIQNSDLMTTIACVYGSQTSPAIFACKTAWLASELLVFMGPSPHVWFLDAKQRLLDRINKSLWVPAIACRFVHAKQRD